MVIRSLVFSFLSVISTSVVGQIIHITPINEFKIDSVHFVNAPDASANEKGLIFYYLRPNIIESFSKNQIDFTLENDFLPDSNFFYSNRNTKRIKYTDFTLNQLQLSDIEIKSSSDFRNLYASYTGGYNLCVYKKKFSIKKFKCVWQKIKTIKCDTCISIQSVINLENNEVIQGNNSPGKCNILLRFDTIRIEFKFHEFNQTSSVTKNYGVNRYSGLSYNLCDHQTLTQLGLNNLNFRTIYIKRNPSTKRTHFYSYLLN